MSFSTCNSQEICMEAVHFKMLIETEEQAMILSETFILKVEHIRQFGCCQTSFRRLLLQMLTHSRNQSWELGQKIRPNVIQHISTVFACVILLISISVHYKPVPSPSLSQLFQPSSHLSLVISAWVVNQERNIFCCLYFTGYSVYSDLMHWSFSSQNH